MSSDRVVIQGGAVGPFRPLRQKLPSFSAKYRVVGRVGETRPLPASARYYLQETSTGEAPPTQAGSLPVVEASAEPAQGKRGTYFDIPMEETASPAGKRVALQTGAPERRDVYFQIPTGDEDG